MLTRCAGRDRATKPSASGKKVGIGRGTASQLLAFRHFLPLFFFTKRLQWRPRVRALTRGRAEFRYVSRDRPGSYQKSTCTSSYSNFCNAPSAEFFGSYVSHSGVWPRPSGSSGRRTGRPPMGIGVALQSGIDLSRSFEQQRWSTKLDHPGAPTLSTGYRSRLARGADSKGKHALWKIRGPSTIPRRLKPAPFICNRLRCEPILPCWACVVTGRHPCLDPSAAGQSRPTPSRRFPRVLRNASRVINLLHLGPARPLGLPNA